ncbi:hypothetical protein CC78DRAFT_607973 [Lojkania enalia]|uniref:Uncharacterized protein n=1 Tax=Lojkania enalia TaxID=147567 RepID=A0A9P4KGK6_9PLEO|nr:hypothetical protein CC78DRAFT_607973 [Didymosphaeria enalia]
MGIVIFLPATVFLALVALFIVSFLVYRHLRRKIEQLSMRVDAFEERAVLQLAPYIDTVAAPRDNLPDDDLSEALSAALSEIHAALAALPPDISERLAALEMTLTDLLSTVGAKK